MSIASEITRLQGVKSDILQAISDKGVVVPVGSALDDCPSLIGDIPTGSSLPTGYAIIGNEVYRTVIIGNMEWLAENLRMTGDWLTIGTTSNNDIPRANYCKSSSYNKNTGLLYNYQAAKYIDDNRETLCPGGWRVPSKSDFETLQILIGGSNQGLKLIYPYMGWNSSDGTNTTMFDGFPMGYYDSSFSDISTKMYLMSRDTYPNESGRCYGFELSDEGSTSISYYWQRWEFNIRLCRPYTYNIGGKDYKCTKMPDGKIWMAENLDFKFEGCGIGGSGSPTTPNAWYYDNDESTWGWNGRKCGLLYNGFAVDLLEQNKSTLIPGWHVPTNAEFTALTTAIGSSPAQKMKSVDLSWFSNWNGTDTYGMSILPVGIRYEGSFNNKGTESYLFTATNYDTMKIAAYFVDSQTGLFYSNFSKQYQGCSLRLVKD